MSDLRPDSNDGAPSIRPPRILVVDDDPIAAESLAEFLADEGYDIVTAFDGLEALDLLDEARESSLGPFAVMLCDITMPKLDGVSLLRKSVKQHAATAVLMITGYGTIEAAVETLRIGAVDYLTKPIVDTELQVAIERAMRHHALASENHALRSQIDQRVGLDNIVGSDHRMLRIFDLVEAVAPSRTTVLMTGESGTGKSMLAHAIHHRSPRANKPYVELSCGSIPETLLESELFGHVKGAFTGAHANKAGKFLAADGGTLFLDEINSASPAMQLKLLRVLQEKRFEPVGSNETIEVDVRVVLASNQPLEDLVSSGEFRQDLYYRINVVKIELPSLRDRISDIPSLANHFLRLHATQLGRQITGISPDALALLQEYTWPGNIRELANVMERAAVLSRSPTITESVLPEHVLQNSSAFGPRLRLGDNDDAEWIPMPLEDALREPERRILMRALRANDWNRQRTADQLKINRTTLYKKMKLLDIRPEDEAA